MTTNVKQWQHSKSNTDLAFTVFLDDHFWSHHALSRLRQHFVLRVTVSSAPTWLRWSLVWGLTVFVEMSFFSGEWNEWNCFKLCMFATKKRITSLTKYDIFLEHLKAILMHTHACRVTKLSLSSCCFANLSRFFFYPSPTRHLRCIISQSKYISNPRNHPRCMIFRRGNPLQHLPAPWLYTNFSFPHELVPMNKNIRKPPNDRFWHIFCCPAAPLVSCFCRSCFNSSSVKA